MLSSAIYFKFMNNGVAKYHDIIFNYPLPASILLSLYKLHQLKSNKDEIDFRTYIETMSNSEIGLIADRNNLDQIQLNVLKNNLFILGSLEFDQKIDEEKRNKYTNRHDVKFTYHIEFSRPHLVRLEYPIIISNNDIPLSLVTNKNSDEWLQNYYDQYEHPFIIYNKYYNYVTDIKRNAYKKYAPLILPNYDEWKIRPYMNNRIYKDYLVIFQSTLAIDNDDIGDYISLDIREDIFPVLDNDAMKLFIEEMLVFQSEASNKTEALLNISIFKDDNLVDPGKYTIDDNLYIKIRDGIDKEAIYRITLNLAIDYERINEQAIIKGLDYEYNDLIIMKNLHQLEAMKIIEIIDIRKDDFESQEIDSFTESNQEEIIVKANNIPLTKTAISKTITPGYTLKMKGIEYGDQTTFRIGRFILRSRKHITT
jgi:hypothetical protein